MNKKSVEPMTLENLKNEQRRKVKNGSHKKPTLREAYAFERQKQKTELKKNASTPGFLDNRYMRIFSIITVIGLIGIGIEFFTTPYRTNNYESYTGIIPASEFTQFSLRGETSVSPSQYNQHLVYSRQD